MKIKRINKIRERTFMTGDIEVANTHSYQLGNKVVSHNSVILGTASGIHPEHSQRYFRIMQMNKTSEMSKWLKDHMPELLEESAWSASNTDYVVYVPIENGSGGKYKDDLNDVEHLEYIKLVQEHWVWEGSEDSTSYSPGTHHNVSNTVLIDDKEKITDYIYDNQKFFGAVSFLSRFGDKDFTQAPFTSVLSTREIIDKYGENALFASGTIVDGIHYFGDLWTACTSVEDKTIQLTGGRDQVLLKQDWIRRVKKFAKNYMKGNLKETIYLLKDVHLAHKWKVVNRVFTSIPDFNSILPPPSYIDVSTLGAIACSGDGCEITAL
jgi:ribonucleoside-triphosphate reductase